ncbi:MAG: alkene reductase [Nostoc sp.]|uniref:alkene reductase n=1 Tax=Nostoc sp. TaxID=1180 RepID=UPI002FFA4BBF
MIDNQNTFTPVDINLFSPYKLGNLELPNRMIMAPCGRGRAGVGNAPVQLNAIYYAQRASAGLIIAEATQVSPSGETNYPNSPGIHSLQQVAGWKLVTDAVHERGGRIFLQLRHSGRISHPDLQPNGALPVAPSAIAPTGNAMTPSGLKPYVTPRAMDTSEIPGIIQQFRQAAENALNAGFDGVEVHGAHGYLLDQFLRSGTNQRTDKYGGLIENRARLLLEVINVVIGVWGKNRVGVRLSPNATLCDMHDSNPLETFGYVATAISDIGLAYLHLTEEMADFGREHTTMPTSYIRDRFCGTLIVNGGYNQERANAVLTSQKADLISFGKLFIANPDLPRRFLLNAPLNQIDPTTLGGAGEKGYTDYPFLTSITND